MAFGRGIVPSRVLLFARAKALGFPLIEFARPWGEGTSRLEIRGEMPWMVVCFLGDVDALTFAVGQLRTLEERAAEAATRSIRSGRSLTLRP